MALIDEIVKVDIKKDNIGTISENLDTLLILGNSNKNKNIRVKSYGSLIEVSGDYGQETPEYKAASLAFSQDIKPTKILIGQCLDDETFAESYPKVVLENNGFYGVMITSKEEADILAIAALVATQEKLFGTSSSDVKVLDNSDTGNILHKLQSHNRTLFMYSKQAEKYPEAAWMGLMLTKVAGSSSWAYKTLSGFAGDNLSTSDRAALESKHGNYFTSVGGLEVVLDGKTANGEYIDIVQGLDWLTTNLKTRIANVFIFSEKVPYTNQGIAVIESMIRNSLNEAVERSIIDESSISISVPDVLKVAKEDRINRILPNVKFEARLAGAIHKVLIQGTVTV